MVGGKPTFLSGGCRWMAECLMLALKVRRLHVNRDFSASGVMDTVMRFRSREGVECLCLPHEPHHFSRNKSGSPSRDIY
jgi:hypothetical protein